MLFKKGYKENFDARWAVLLLFVNASFFATSSNKISSSSFPYEFWKPQSPTDARSLPLEPSQNPLEQEYGYFYGHPLAADEVEDPSTWTLLPIKVPKDVVGHAREKTTLNPLKDVTTYPSSFTPQYGRYPGATEAPPLFFPQRFASKFFFNQEAKLKDTARVYKVKNKRKPPLWKYKNYMHQRQKMSFSNPKFSYVPNNSLRKTSNEIKISSFDRNKELSPHAFYSIQDSPKLKMGLLHKNKTHTLYFNPEDYNKKAYKEKSKTRIYNKKKSQFIPVGGNYDILDYSRYELQKDLHRPHTIRKNYNENLIDLIRKKVESKTHINNQLKKPLHLPEDNIFLNNSGLQSDLRGAQKQRESLVRWQKKQRNPFGSGYSSLNSIDKLRYNPNNILKAQESQNNPIFKDPKLKITYPTRHSNYNPIKYNVDNRLASRLKNLFTAALSLDPPFALKAYPKKKEIPHSTEPPKRYLYFYNKADHDEYQSQSNSILERIASIQNAPVSLAVPGGLVALGLGLAYYYFNYVWYPTPVVKARLSKFFQIFGQNRDLNQGNQTQGIGKVCT